MAYSKREVAVVVVLAMLACMAVAEGAVSCGTVSNSLSKCLSYLVGTVAAPATGCCPGVKSLYTTTLGSKADRIVSCNCIKTLSKSLASKLKSDRISKLPSICGVNLGYSISANTNCNSIK